MKRQAPFIALAMAALLAGLWAGLIRIGWNLPPIAPILPSQHGPLMVAGFVGTLVSLERASAIGRQWAYLAPLSSAVGALLLLISPSIAVGPFLITLGSAALIAVFVLIVRRQPAVFTYTMLTGTAMWFVGNLLWFLGASVFQVVLWWIAFLILTVAGERLELGRMRRLSRTADLLFLVSVSIISLGLVWSLVDRAIAVKIAGGGVVLMALWLARYDIARRTVRQMGLTRFIAAAMLSGYFWLGLGGFFALVFDRPFASQLQYDALLHTLLLGFIMSMIFGHAPIIFPALVSRPLHYSPLAYSPLVLLHASLALRVSGDLIAQTAAREWGGLLNVIAILLFVGTTVVAMLAGKQRLGVPA